MDVPKMVPALYFKWQTRCHYLVRVHVEHGISMEVIQPSGRRSNRRLTAMEIYRSLRTENGFESTMACHYNNMVAAVSADIYIMAVNLAEKSGIEAPPKGFF